jgi:hypothetical protein
MIDVNLPQNLYYIYDYSEKIVYNTSLPRLLHSIIYIDSRTERETIVYKRYVGKHTKSPCFL